MPKVPILPQVRSEPVRTPRAGGDPRGVYGDSIGQGLQQLGAGLAEAGGAIARAEDQEYARANAVKREEASTELERRITPRFFDDKAGFFHQLGENAVAAHGPAFEGLQKDVDEISQKLLVNDQQREEFRLHAAARVVGLQRDAENYLARQLDVAADAAAKARQEAALGDLSRNYANPESRAYQMAAVEKAIRDLRSPSKEATEAEVTAFRAKAGATVVQSAIQADQLDVADQLFAEYSPALGTYAGPLKATLELAHKDKAAENTAIDIIEKSRGGENGWVDQGKAMEAIDQVPTGKLRDEVRQRVEHRLQLADRQVQRDVDSYFKRALTAYETPGAGGLRAIARNDERWLRQHAPEDWRKLEMMARGDAAHYRALREGRSEQATPEQQHAMTEFLVAAADHPETFAVMPLERWDREWKTRLAREDWEQAGRVLANLHGTATKADKLSPLEDRMLLRVGREAGVFPEGQNDTSKWDDEQFSTHYRAVQELSELAADYKRANGKPPPLDVVQQWASSLLLKGTVPGSGTLFDDETTRIQAEMKGTAFSPEFSDEDLDEARRKLEQHGARPTDRNVEIFLRKKHGLPAPSVQADVEEPEAEEPKASAPPKPSGRSYPSKPFIEPKY